VAAGFGDTNGVSNPGRPDKAANIGKLGSFDVAPGTPGPAVKGGNVGKLGGFDIAGGTTPGPSGKAGNIGKVGGFDAVAGNGGGGGPAGRPAVTDGGFGNAAAAPKTQPATRKPVEQPEKPVEITFKPRPDYTEEARKMRIEGEVLLRVLFTSSGEARVLDMIRGLGHGLNENAVRSVGQIRFKPAVQDGQPVDSTAIVHIVFQLAY
jgi:TonB family protein